MNAPDRFVQLATATELDRKALRNHEAEISRLERELAEEQDSRAKLAASIEVSEAMLMHAQRTYNLTVPTETVPDPLPTEAVAQASHEANPTVTQRLPEIEVKDGVAAVVVEPDGDPASGQRRLTLRRTAKAAQDGGELGDR